MNKISLRIRLLGLILVVMWGVIGCTSNEESTSNEKRNETPIEDLTYEMVDGEIVITGYTGVDREIYIPDEINGRPVTQIGVKAFAEYDMTLVDIPDSVMIIHEKAFYNCECLEDLRLPDSALTIEEYAFSGCEVLADVDLPEDLQYLGSSSFGSTAIKKLTIPDDFTGFEIWENHTLSFEIDQDGNRHHVVGDLIKNPLTGCDGVMVVKKYSKAWEQLVCYSHDRIEFEVIENNQTESSDSVPDESTPSTPFKYCKLEGGIAIEKYTGADKMVDIPSQIDGLPVTVIMREAFCENTTITEVYIPKSVNGIDESAFQGCSNLEKVVFQGNGEVVIGYDVFSECSKLKEVELPEGAYFRMQFKSVWNEEKGVYDYVKSNDPILPIDEDDVTVLVVYEGSKAHKALLGSSNVKINFKIK